MTSGERWRLGHRPGLDGLRGVAVLLVVGSHFAVPGFANLAQPGVTAFFVLSGFLITALLLEERERTGRIALGRFYLRRMARLAPALVVCVGLVSAFALAVGVSTNGAVPALTYVMNFVQASGEHYQRGLFGHTWSLAIEEQFYLIWPLALMLLLSRVPLRRLWPVLAGGAVAVTAWRVALEATGAPMPRTAYGLDTRSDALLAGCALAAYLHAGGTPGSSVALGRVLGARALSLIGRRSYAVYLWHYPVVLLLLQTDPFMPWWERTLIAGPITAVVVAASWRYVEAPFLRLRPSLSSVAGPPRELPGSAGVHRTRTRGSDPHVQPELDLT